MMCRNSDLGSSNFDIAMDFTMKWERGYVNHPDDPGGATKDGVTQRVYNAWRRSRSLAIRAVSLLTRGERDAIYRKRYWKKAGCPIMPTILSIAVFDYAVHSGTRRAVRQLQKLVGTVPDGIFGPHTEKWVKRTISLKEPEKFVHMYIEERMGFLQRLGRKRRYRAFLRGWMNRIDDLLKNLIYRG